MKKVSLGAPLLLLAILILSSAPAALPVEAVSGSNCSEQSNPYSVIGANWGTAGSPTSVYPGDLDVPLTVTMLFYGPCTSAQSSFVLSFQQGVAPLPFTAATTGGAQTPENLLLNVQTGSLVTETFYLNVAQSATTGITYEIPLDIQYSNGTVSYLSTELTSVPIQLFGSVQLGFGVNTSHLTPGVENNVTVSISNSGASTSGPVSTTVTPPSGVTLLNQLATTTTLAPGATSTQVLEVFVSSSLGGSALILTFSAKYVDPYSITDTYTQTVGFTVSGGSSVLAATSFVVQGASWGSATSTASPLPGTQDEPLVVSIQYLGSTPVTSLEGVLQLPAGITNLNGGSTGTAYSAANTNQYGSLTLTFNLDLAGSVAPGTYNFSLSLQWMTSQSLGLSESATVTPPPIASLQSTFLVEGATWQRSANGSSSSAAASPAPGSVDVPLVVTLQYLGTTTVSAVQGKLALPAGFTDLSGDSTATAYAATATANQVVTLTFYLNLAGSVKPGTFSFPLALSWQSSAGVAMTQSATASPPPVASASASSVPLAVSQENSTITAGSRSSSTFTITNDGTATIYSPTFSLQVTNPVVLAAAGSPVPVAEVAPGSNATFDAQLTAGPSATPGIYGGTLTVVFTDSSGTSHTQSFPLSFTVEGTVTFILQDTTISQASSGFTVTGSILNEGSVAAYYASITGLIEGSSATPIYIGEIDPNTPTPFSVTIPFTAPATVAAPSNSTAGSASTTVTRTGARSFSLPGNFTSRSFTFNGTFPSGTGPLFNGTSGLGAPSTGTGGSATVALTLSYQDTFGNAKSQAFAPPTTVKTASELSGGQVTSFRTTSSGTSDLTYAAYAVVAVVLVTLVVGAVMVRKFRAKKMEAMPMEEKSVI